MKCKICKQKTNWDESVGRPAFIVCNHCVENLSEHMLELLKFSSKDKIGALCATTAILLDIGYAMEGKED
jgi:hypothetical protein